MTLPQFATIVNAYVQPFGQTYLGALDPTAITSDQLNAITRGLQRFTYDTLYGWDDRITLTLSVDAYLYDLRDPNVVSRPVALPTEVFIGGDKIERLDSAQDISRVEAAYLTQSAGTPALWYLRRPDTLVLSPAASAVGSNNFISGFWLHPPVNVSQPILIADEDAEAAAKDVAMLLLEPYSIGFGEQTNHFAALAKRLDAEKATIRKRSERYFNPDTRRRGRAKSTRLAW